MEFDRESVKKIRGLIIFTAIIVLCLWEYNKVFDILGFVFHIMFPFILG